ncbi:hypothetical protein ACHAWT_000638 [Skeletonema menzelii]
MCNACSTNMKRTLKRKVFGSLDEEIDLSNPLVVGNTDKNTSRFDKLNTCYWFSLYFAFPSSSLPSFNVPFHFFAASFHSLL